MENNEKKYYGVYARKSKFTGKGESIDNQIEYCKNTLITKFNAKDEDIKIYSDEGFTGYNTNRPQLQKLMTDIKKNKIQCVIVYRLDRISRNVADFCNLKNELLQYDVKFISVTENFDTSTPMGVAMLMISSVFAQLERDTIAERIRDNMYELAKTGRWLGGNTPLGYKSQKIETIDIDGKKRSLYKLDVIPEEAETIKLLWTKMLELKGLSKLETYLLNNGIKTRNGNNFSRFSLVTIFKNPVYVIADEKINNFFEEKGATIYHNSNEQNKKNIYDKKLGLIAYNKRLEITGKAKSFKDINEWIIAVGKHNGLITSDQFISVWNLITNNQNKRLRAPQQNTSILSGIIKCKHCGSYMRPRLRNSIASNGERNFSYLCELKDKSRKKQCQCKNINGIETDKLVIQKLKEITSPKSEFMKRLEDLASGREKESTKKQTELQTLNATFTKNKMKIETLIDRMAIIDPEIINEVALQIKDLKSKNNEIEKRIAEMNKEIDAEIDQKQMAKIALDMIKNYMESFDTLDIVEKRLMIKMLISSVESDGENLYINLIGSSSKQKCPQCDGSRSNPQCFLCTYVCSN